MRNGYLTLSKYALQLVIVCFIVGSSVDSFAKPTFSKPHGVYEKSFSVTITPSVAGSQIRYTIDGSIPTASSQLYSGPLSIDKTTILRVLEVGVDTIPSTVSYIFTESVLNQSNNPEGYPSVWGPFCFENGNAPADYEMDPEILKNNTDRRDIISAMKEIPVLSIVTDKENLFGSEQDENKGGIYYYTGTYEGNGNGIGKGWTRPASVELFGTSSTESDHPYTLDMIVNCGLRLHGGSSRVPEKSPKHSFRLIFKKEYGEESGKLNYPLFGPDEPTGYDQLIVRSPFCLTWHYWIGAYRPRAQYTRDVWTRRMQRKMGHLSSNALYVNVFLNGLYWGLYNITERIDAQFCKIHMGGKKSDYDVIKVEDDIEDVIEASEGNLDQWNEMVKLVRNCKDNESYIQLQKLLDIDNFIDYMLINQYIGNTDWGRHNWFAVNKKGSDSKGFQFVCWDSEAIFVALEENVLQLNDKESPTEFFNCLLRNKSFSDRYVKRAKELLSPNGLLGEDAVVELWDSLYYATGNSVYAESARWGDYRRDVHPYGGEGSLYTIGDHFTQERGRLKYHYFPYRSQTVLDDILSYVEEIAAGIDTPTTQLPEEESKVYDLSGKAVLQPRKGIYIKKGRKISVRSISR